VSKSSAGCFRNFVIPSNPAINTRINFSSKSERLAPSAEQFEVASDGAICEDIDRIPGPEPAVESSANPFGGRGPIGS